MESGMWVKASLLDLALLGQEFAWRCHCEVKTGDVEIVNVAEGV